MDFSWFYFFAFLEVKKLKDFQVEKVKNISPLQDLPMFLLMSVEPESYQRWCLYLYFRQHVATWLFSIYVVVNFLFQVIFIFPLFLGMVIYANEFETKEKQKLHETKS